MKKLYYGFHLAVGRNRGRISSYHRGGGLKRSYLFIDRFRSLFNLPAKIINFYTIPGRFSRIALLLYTNGVISFIPAIDGLKVGDYVYSTRDTGPSILGSSLSLSHVKVGTRVSSIELYPGFGAVVSRAPGLFSVVVRKYSDLVLLKLSSGEFRFFLNNCACTVGTNSTFVKPVSTFKAGFSRIVGKRPVVRGRAMNPVDHPHGGRTNGGMVPTTPWARHVKGQKTSRSTSVFRLKISKV